MANKTVIKNTAMLYLMNIAKMIFPLVTLPYLTRILSVESYGVVAYVKAVMQYMQIFIDFGFILSGTRDIVNSRDDHNRLNQEVSDIFLAKLLTAFVSLIILLLLVFLIPLLREYTLFTLLSFLPVFLSIFLFDYLFRGLEVMEVISIRYVIMKSISTALVFIFIKNNEDLLWIPCLDIIGTLVAILWILYELRKQSIAFIKPSFSNSLKKIGNSSIFFISDISTTAFLALNTLIIGLVLSKKDVAYWSVCLQLVGAVLSLYNPISNGVYPYMIKNKDIRIIKHTISIIMPVVILGCIVTFFIAHPLLIIVGGESYGPATPILRALIPVMLFGFPSILYGWPVLGAIGKEKENTKVTIEVAIIQVLGLLFLYLFDSFTLLSISLLRGTTEFLLFIGRYIVYKQNIDAFLDNPKEIVK